MSKGSSPRPFLVSNEEYSNRWDAIFQKDEKKNETQNLESVGPNTTRSSRGSDNTTSDSGQAQVS